MCKVILSAVYKNLWSSRTQPSVSEEDRFGKGLPKDKGLPFQRTRFYKQSNRKIIIFIVVLISREHFKLFSHWPSKEKRRHFLFFLSLFFFFFFSFGCGFCCRSIIKINLSTDILLKTLDTVGLH